LTAASPGKEYRYVGINLSMNWLERCVHGWTSYDKEMASARRKPRRFNGGSEAYDGFSLCHDWFLLDETE
jgi:hypothetical protein